MFGSFAPDVDKMLGQIFTTKASAAQAKIVPGSKLPVQYDHQNRKTGPLFDQPSETAQRLCRSAHADGNWL